MRDADCGSVFISGLFLFIERLHQHKFQGESVVSGSHFECGQDHALTEVCYAVHPVAMAPNEAGIVQSGNIMLSRPTWAQAGAKSQGVRTWNRTSCIGGLRKLCENIRRACTL